MKKIWTPIIETSEDFQKAASKLIDDGISFFQGTFGSMQLFASSEALVGSQNMERDETHYLLIPNRSEASGYCLYSARVLPQGVGPENNLPKAKIFQLPGEGAEQHLITLLMGQLEEKGLAKATCDSPLADRLEIIADEVDKQSTLLSGGLLLVGGAVALANPILGVGIAAKAFAPNLASKISVHGVKHASSWLRTRQENSVKKEVAKTAQREVRQIKPELRVNRILELLEQALSTSDGSFDPGLASENLLDDLSTLPDLRLAVQALAAVYAENATLDPTLRCWIDSLTESILT